MGYTPNFLVFGREVRSPADMVYGIERSDPTQGYDSFADDLRVRMKTAYDQVRENTKQYARYNKKYYDIKVRPKQFQPGQWVWYLNLRKALGNNKSGYPSTRDHISSFAYYQRIPSKSRRIPGRRLRWFTSTS